MPFLRDWKFCRQPDCPERESDPDFRNDIFARQWLGRHKDDVLVMRAQLLEQGILSGIQRFTDAAVFDQIAQLLDAGDLHIHSLADPCYGCAIDIKISNILPFNKGRDGKTWFGHQFDVNIDMNFIPGTNDLIDCTLEWWEKTNVPASDFVKENEWIDLFPYFKNSDVMTPWKNKKIPCPGGGPLSVTITDFPVLILSPDRTGTRTTKFHIKVNSHINGKQCANASKFVTAKQVLELRNGQPVGKGTFITPSDEPNDQPSVNP